MENVKKVFLAFLCGGCIGVLTEGILAVYSHLPVSHFAQVSLAFLSIGLLGAILFISGLYQRIEKKCGFGIMMPICGLPAAVASGIVAALKKGKTQKEACKEGVMHVASVIIFGILFTVIYATAIELIFPGGGV